MYNAHLFRQVVSTRRPGFLGDDNFVPYWPENMPYMKARWINGRRADDLWMQSSPYPPNSVLWNDTERKLAWNVALREMYRLWGPPKTEQERLDRDDRVKALLSVELAEDNIWHVFSSRPTKEQPDWRRWACFCNFYWWLSPAYRDELRSDMANSGALWRWAPVAIDQMQPRCPVMNDPAYKSSTSVLLASEDWANLLGSNAYAMPPGIKGLADAEAFPWPVVDAAGNPVLPPWLSLPGPCSPFPQCLASVWPAWLPQIPLGQLWAMLAAWVKQNPSELRMLRDADGGVYTAAATSPPAGRPPSPPVGTQPTTAVPSTPPPEQRLSPFVEKHTTNEDGTCRWYCSVDSVNKATDLQTCRQYADCQIRNDPQHANADLDALTNQCISALGGNGVGWFLQSSGPEACKAAAPPASPTWWGENWKYVVGGGAALAVLGTVVALVARKPRSSFAAGAAEEEVSSRVRRGTRVRFGPSPASLVLYSDPPRVGSQGTVTAIPVGSRSVTYLPGPGGGLVYVDWDDHGVAGVSPRDLWYVRERLEPADVGERIENADVGESGESLKVGDPVAYKDVNLRYDPHYQGVVVALDAGRSLKVRWPNGMVTTEWAYNLVRQNVSTHVGEGDRRTYWMYRRVQLHPGTDAWMQGDRYGVVVGVGRSKNLTVKLDSGREIRLPEDRVSLVEELEVGERGSGKARARKKAQPCKAAAPVDPAYRARIEELAWAKLHRDFRTAIKGVRYMTYLNPNTGGTELWPMSAVPLSHLEWTAGVRRDI